MKAVIIDTKNLRKAAFAIGFGLASKMSQITKLI